MPGKLGIPYSKAMVLAMQDQWEEGVISLLSPDTDQVAGEYLDNDWIPEDAPTIGDLVLGPEIVGSSEN